MKRGSRFLNNLLIWVHGKRHPHMLKRINPYEFEITYKHMRDPTWKNQDISLFVEMDSLFKQYNVNSPKYAEECRGRFKANLRRLCDKGMLADVTCMEDGSKTQKRTIRKKRFRLLQKCDELDITFNGVSRMEQMIIDQSLFVESEPITVNAVMNDTDLRILSPINVFVEGNVNNYSENILSTGKENNVEVNEQTSSGIPVEFEKSMSFNGWTLESLPCVSENIKDKIKSGNDPYLPSIDEENITLSDVATFGLEEAHIGFGFPENIEENSSLFE